MLNPTLIQTYRQYRNWGYTAFEAMYAARWGSLDKCPLVQTGYVGPRFTDRPAFSLVPVGHEWAKWNFALCSNLSK